MDSFSATIYQALAERAQAPKEAQDWLEMVTETCAATGFPLGLDSEGLRAAFVAHNDAVRATIPANRLLVFQVTEGWAPLCEFLDVPVPDEPFPRSNDREEFWERVSGNV
jgi:hypothetical protein